ncbi:hypothetical protein GX441_07610 [bacterium]|nr:hypothetical protein [bacterium]
MSLILTILLYGAGFSDPHCPNGESLVYKGYDDGNKTSRDIIHKVYDMGGYYYSTHEHLDTTRILVKCKMRKSDLSTLQVIKDRSGRFQLGIEPTSGGILVKNGPKSTETKVKYAGVFYDRHTLIDVFRGFPFENPRTVEFAFFESNVGSVITGTCNYAGIVGIKTDTGDFDCYKLTLGFKSQLIETVYQLAVAGRSFDFYYEVEEPHRMIYWTDNKGSYLKLKQVDSEGE